MFPGPLIFGIVIVVVVVADSEALSFNTQIEIEKERYKERELKEEAFVSTELFKGEMKLCTQKPTTLCRKGHPAKSTKEHEASETQ